MSRLAKSPSEPTSVLLRRVVVFETLGFGFLLALLVVDDLVTLPKALGSKGAVSWELVEIAAGFAVAALTLVMTRSLMRRIRFLEGLISVCMYCKRVRADDQWISIERYVATHSEAEFSHGLCPECLEKNFEARPQGS
jgi:hypothetical protein